MSEDKINQSEDESVSVVITEADFSDEALKAEVIKRLLSKENGELERPRISAVRAVLNIIIPLILSAALFCTLFFTLETNRLAISLSVSLGALALYTVLRLRSIIIWFIRVYQRFAPDDVRRRCVFTPTCSQYAIQALQRYGVVRGVPKIISRLNRCRPENGGEDPLK